MFAPDSVGTFQDSDGRGGSHFPSRFSKGNSNWTGSGSGLGFRLTSCLIREPLPLGRLHGQRFALHVDIRPGRQGRRPQQANCRPRRSADRRGARYWESTDRRGNKRAGGSTCGSRQAPRCGRRRRQAKRSSLADKLTVEANTLAGLKIEKAAVEGERRTAEADLGPVRYLATLIGQPTRWCSGGSSSSWRCCLTRPQCSCCLPRPGGDELQ